MNERTLPQAVPPASTGTQAATPDQLKRSAELSANASGDAPRSLTDRYELRELLAKGGMGTVHAAWDKTFDRAIAVKLIHDHLVDDHAIKRFQHEARIAGQLQHPNIPPVYDLGHIDGTKPYLAMKLVKGRTLDDHIKHPGPDTPNLVAVFEAIAQAIGYAHSRGVIHRDLKPQNVMVGAFGEVQVMDWGLAKVKSDDRPEPVGGRQPSETTEPTADPDATTGYGTRIGSPNDTRTTAGSVLGTPAYMPPEQARGDLDQITERSDVFGLGAILCTILTGHSVFGGGTAEQARRKSASGDVADAFFRLDASAAEPELIALAKKCLAPDAADRFANGTEVANETARIRAESEARAKQAELERTKAEADARAQRKRRQVMTWSAAVVTLVLTAGIVGTALGLREAKAQEENAKNEAIAKGVALEAEKVAKAEAEKNLAFAKKGNEIIGSVFDGLDPEANYSTISEFTDMLKANLAKAEKEIDSTSIGNPLDVAEMRFTLGRSLLGLGEVKPAIDLLERARAILLVRLGPDHPHTLACLHSLAMGYKASGQLAKAMSLNEETLKLRMATLGRDHPQTLSSMNNLALSYKVAGQLDKAMPLFEETLRLRIEKFGPEDPQTVTSMNNLAMGYQAAGRLDKALPRYEESLKLAKTNLGPDHPHTLTSINNLASAYRATGQIAKALPLFEESLKLRVAKLGPDHPQTLMSMGSLAGGYRTAGRLDKAVPLHEETVKLMKVKLGTDHLDTLVTMANLAMSYEDAGQLDKALPLHEETFKLMKVKLGPDHPETLTCMNNLAGCYYRVRDIDKALPILHETMTLMKAKLGPDHPDTLRVIRNLAVSYRTAGQRDKSLPLDEEYLNGQRRRGLSGTEFSGQLAVISQRFLQVGEYQKTGAWLSECLEIREKEQSDLWSTFETRSMLGEALLGQKKYADAEPLLIKGYEGLINREKTIPPQSQARLPEALDRLIWLYTATNRPAEARKYRELRAKYPKERAPTPRPHWPAKVVR